MWMLICLVSQRLLKISLLIKILFCLCFWLPWLNEIHCLVFQLADLFSYLIHSAVESLQCIFQFSCNPWSCKESDITERLHFFLFFCLVLSYIFCLLIEILTVHPFSSQVWWASLWPLLWTLYQLYCLSLFWLILFSGFCLVLLIGTYIPLSPHFA